jgi:hypothetical protein
MMNYGQIISKAWKSMWKGKILWVFGVLAGELTIRSLVITLIPRNQPMVPSTDDPILQYLYQVQHQYNLDAEGILFYVFFGLLAVLVIARILVMLIGSIGVRRGVVAVRQDKPLELAGLFQEALRFFWRMLGFSVISTFIVALVLSPFFFFSYFYMNAPERMLLFFLLSCGLFLLMLVPLWLFSYGSFIMVINDWSIRDSIVEAWNFVIRQHLGQFIVLGLVIGFVSAGISLLFSIPNFIISVITMNEAFLRTPEQAALTGDTLTRLLSLIVQLYSAWWRALLVVFGATAFVHAYLDLKESDMEENLPLPTDRDDFLAPKPREEILFTSPDEVSPVEEE